MIRSIHRFCCISLLCTASLSRLTAAPFTIAVIGDQQVPVLSTTYYPSFTAQTNWIAANAQTNKIRFVTQVGDIVQNGNRLAEYDRAEAAMVTLDTATNADGGTGIPWNVNYGNHEEDRSQAGADPAGPWAHNYRDYFGSASGTHRYAGQPQYKGVSSNDLNTWHIIKSSNAIDAREYLMLNLEYDAPGHRPGSTPDPADVPAFDAIAWAQGIIDANPGMATIITTHVFEGTAHGPPNNPYTSGPGRNSQIQIFDKLVKNNPQVFMVLSGHTSQSTHQVKQNAAGLNVLQMVTDYNKVLPNGGDGFFRLVELDEDTGEIRVKTYTPGVPQNPTPRFDTSANGQFTISMDWTTRFPPVSGPLMGAPTVNSITDDGATVGSQLRNENADNVTLEWAFVDQGESSVATWTAASGGGSHSFGAAVKDAVLTRVLSGLQGDTEYHFRFLATGTTESDWSSVGSFSTGLDGIAHPASFTGVAGSISEGTKVDLSWIDSYSSETGFIIRRSTDPAFGTYDTFALAANSINYEDETTAENTSYYYCIAAVGKTGNGTFTSNLTVATGDPGAGPIAGLIGHWKFDESGDTTTAVDSSVNDNDATTAAGGSWVAGSAGNGYNNPRFTLSDSSDLNLTGAVPVTISLWAKPNAAHGFTCLAGFEGTGSTGDIYAFKTNGSDKIQFTPSNIVTPDTLMNYSNAGSKWVHIVGVHEPGVGSRIYIDGVQVTTSTSAPNIPVRTNAVWTMGTYWNSNSYNYNGDLDDVQVYNKALTASEVTSLFNNPGTPLLAANPTFTDWIAAYSVGTETGFRLDPDGDGIENGLEAWFGTRPDLRSTGLSKPIKEGKTITFSHPVNQQFPTDIHATYQWSPDLVNWYAGDGEDGSASGLTMLITSTHSGNTATVTAVANELSSPIFLRARATQNF